MPFRYLCPRCHGRFAKPGRCVECTRADNKRRNAKRAAHGRTTAWWRRFRRAYIGSECERCGSTDYLTFHFKPGGVRNANPADYETLCRRCHGAVDAPRAHADKS
jgi:5-methylcytosine-specific restriction endonuclease McrA